MNALGLFFQTPLLLLGLLAVGIPVLLHLLARSRAQEVLFPTLRFLRISMEKTARRRRLQHVLLMFLRMAVLGLLALAAAEPISQALGGWMGGRSTACVLIVDNSLSMSARTGEAAGGSPSRLDQARSEAKVLLSGADRPALAALWTTNGPAPQEELTSRLDSLRLQAEAVAPSFGQAPIAQRVAAAVEVLRKQSVPQKAIALFSDLQKVSFEELLAAEGLAKVSDVHVLVVNTAQGRASNVGVTGVKVEGRPIVGQLQTVTATVENSSATQRVVHVGLRAGGEEVGQKVRLSLAPAGAEGGMAVAKFNWWPREAGDVPGEVEIDESDLLPQDNRRRFCRRLGGRIRALIVRGPVADERQPVSDPAWMLNLALDPFADPGANRIVEARKIDADRFTPEALAGAEIVFLCDVPRFTPEQAIALEERAAGGATVVFFLGPSVDAANYNDVLQRSSGPDGGLLPAPILPAVGEVGPLATALFLKWVDLQHPYFQGLYKDLTDVKEDIRGFVQRRYGLGKGPRPPAELVRLENDEPLIVAKPFGRGRVVLCLTSAAPGWSNLPATSLFPPMVIRMSLLARAAAGGEEAHLAGVPVAIRPREMGEANEVSVTVSLPPGEDGKVAAVTVRAVRTAEGLWARFTQTDAAGVYSWKAASPAGPAQDEYGVFVVNPPEEELRLQALTPEALRQGLEAKGFHRAYVGGSFAQASAAALAAAQKRNWWDLLAAAAIVALVAEALVANRAKTQRNSAIPAHLNPKIVA